MIHVNYYCDNPDIPTITADTYQDIIDLDPKDFNGRSVMLIFKPTKLLEGTIGELTKWQHSTL